jgi:hypothetical protein
MKTIALLPIVVLAACATNDDSTVSGSWVPSSKAAAGQQHDCDDSGLPQDVVQIYATAYNPDFQDSFEVGCDVAGFEISVPRGSSSLHIQFQVVGDSHFPPAASLDVAGPILDDVDLGDVKLSTDL